MPLNLSDDDPDLEKRLSDELDAINDAAVAATDHRNLAIRLTDDDGTLIGGITGYTWGGCGGLTSLWLSPAHRGQGHGTRLLTAAEAEIRRRGCDRVVVATMSFHAPGFYLRHGYREVGRTPGMPGNTTKHHFHKHLA
ncbi:GNAT superfamily N-acetyltransferase [Catenuloplanes nepalensis]|uniref:GNAT superfamily N-acetyltransferase n=1 Tax=Catenuloplanes nepalensis TaxID=587533 RepID=A0ABT9MVE1_9ACTN|nr:GNAT family N-acetyltransferase [Catenuloplanes nepalensis]MDP9795349.1 GNAT superfamily N-acetyltransferase [Catenuloplanes nepalensis]